MNARTDFHWLICPKCNGKSKVIIHDDLYREYKQPRREPVQSCDGPGVIKNIGMGKAQPNEYGVL